MSTALLQERAASRVQTGESEPRHQLTIAGEDFTDASREITATFAAEAGGSELTFSPARDLRDYEDAPVVLWLGYGSGRSAVWIPYFAGKLKRIPDRGGSVFPRAARALGAFSEMTSRSFGEEVTYRNVTAEFALYDIVRRAEYASGTVEIRSGRTQRVEEVVFYEEVTLQEAAKSVMDSTGFVGGDVPGVYGSRVFMPRPRPAATGKAKRIFTERDYPSDGLTVTEKYDAAYSRVVVFRRNQEGGYDVRAEAPVPESPGQKYPAPMNRVYYVPEFIGDGAEARQVAYDTARSLASGEVSVELSGVSIDPTLTRYDQVQVERLDERRDGTYREVFAVTMDEDVGVSVAGWSMGFGGAGMLVEERKVARPRVYAPGLTAGLVALPLDGLTPDTELVPNLDLVPAG